MNELYVIPLYALGAILTLGGALWLLIRAFGVSKLWGAAILLLGFPALFFALVHRRKGLFPLLLVLVGLTVTASPFLWNYYFPPKIDDRAKIEDKPPEEVPVGPAFTPTVGKRLTLTGSARIEYLVLKEDKSFTLIQWANPDVTDEDAAVLKEMKDLEELDLNGTQVTDATAKNLAELPKLRVLRIARTQITPAQVQELLKRPSLQEIDVRNLKVPRAELQKWKDQDPMTRKFVN
jgi:hypothetical protein